MTKNIFGRFLQHAPFTQIEWPETVPVRREEVQAAVYAGVNNVTSASIQWTVIVRFFIMVFRASIAVIVKAPVWGCKNGLNLD